MELVCVVSSKDQNILASKHSSQHQTKTTVENISCLELLVKSKQPMYRYYSSTLYSNNKNNGECLSFYSTV